MLALLTIIDAYRNFNNDDTCGLSTIKNTKRMAKQYGGSISDVKLAFQGKSLFYY